MCPFYKKGSVSWHIEIGVNSKTILLRIRAWGRFDTPKSPTSLILTIRAGEGGEDSKLFVEDLSSAYLKYAASKNFKIELLDDSYGNWSFQISGEKVWDTFKEESGKHIVQRVSPTERGSRSHTSVVVVGILGLFEFNNKPLKDCELDIKAQRGSGPGGQHRNKTESAIRAKHIPTGIQVFISSGRDQSQNKKKALEILASRVNQFYLEKEQSKYDASRKDQLADGGRTGKKRTYNFIENRVTDHITGKKTTKIKEIMKGDFDLIK